MTGEGEVVVLEKGKVVVTEKGDVVMMEEGENESLYPSSEGGNTSFNQQHNLKQKRIPQLFLHFRCAWCVGKVETLRKICTCCCYPLHLQNALSRPHSPGRDSGLPESSWILGVTLWLSPTPVFLLGPLGNSGTWSQEEHPCTCRCGSPQWSSTA